MLEHMDNTSSGKQTITGTVLDDPIDPLRGVTTLGLSVRDRHITETSVGCTSNIAIIMAHGPPSKSMLESQLPRSAELLWSLLRLRLTLTKRLITAAATRSECTYVATLKSK